MKTTEILREDPGASLCHNRSPLGGARGTFLFSLILNVHWCIFIVHSGEFHKDNVHASISCPLNSSTWNSPQNSGWMCLRCPVSGGF